MLGGSEPVPEGAMVFTFTNANPNILNSIVVDSANRPLYKITTNSSLEGYTQFKDVENKAIALVEWITQPKVEIRGSLPKVTASEWVPVFADQRFGRYVLVEFNLRSAWEDTKAYLPAADLFGE
jgi:hypothetical protein